MPFNFQLLVEFFFSGVITFISILLLFDVIEPSKAKDLTEIFNSSGKLLFTVFISGLVSYYIGTVVNALSNKIIREFFSGYRIRMIRRKLGLLIEERPTERENLLRKLIKKAIILIKSRKDKKPKYKFKTLSELEEDRCNLIRKLIPSQITGKEEDKLKEIYTAVRNYCGIHSKETNQMISYHWGLLRLSRATILPLFLLCLVLTIRLVFPGNNIEEFFTLVVGAVVLIATIFSYSYREKFLIYTVFDIFFISQKNN